MLIGHDISVQESEVRVMSARREISERCHHGVFVERGGHDTLATEHERLNNAHERLIESVGRASSTDIMLEIFNADVCSPKPETPRSMQCKAGRCKVRKQIQSKPDLCVQRHDQSPSTSGFCFPVTGSLVPSSFGRGSNAGTVGIAGKPCSIVFVITRAFW